MQQIILFFDVLRHILEQTFRKFLVIWDFMYVLTVYESKMIKQTQTHIYFLDDFGIVLCILFYIELILNGMNIYEI